MALDSKSPTIGAMQREKNKAFTESLIIIWLAYLNQMLNLNKPMHDDQIEMCATEIMNEFYMLNFSDLTLLFKRIISGQFGKFYESLSIADVLTFFREYNEERYTIASQRTLRKHEAIKSDQTFNISGNLRRVFLDGAKPMKNKKK